MRRKLFPFFFFCPGGGGVLPYKRLMGVCRWIGGLFNRVSIMGSHIFAFLGVIQFSICTDNKRTRMFVVQMKSKVFLIQSKMWHGSIHRNRK